MAKVQAQVQASISFGLEFNATIYMMLSMAVLFLISGGFMKNLNISNKVFVWCGFALQRSLGRVFQPKLEMWLYESELPL